MSQVIKPKLKKLVLRLLSAGLLLECLVTLAYAGQVRKYVYDHEDFLLHMRAHVARVESLGLALNEQLLLEGQGVLDMRMVREFLKLHDQSKVNPYFSKNRERLISEDLYMGYGKNFVSIPEREKQIYLKLVRELNAIDEWVGKKFLKDHGLMDSLGALTKEGQTLRFIEKVADQVDRGMNPVSSEEFDKVMEPASLWMKDPQESRWARYFEDKELYQKITRGLHLSDFKERIRNSKCISGLGQLLFGPSPDGVK